METNFEWCAPAFYTNIVGGTNRGAYSLISSWDPYPSNLWSNGVNVAEAYDAAWIYMGKSNFVGGLLTNYFTVIINPYRNTVVTVTSKGATMMVTSNLFSPVWFPVSTNEVRLTNPLGNWFWIGTNVSIQTTNF